MAQQKIQMEVGTNLPPLKNDVILEKKRELEEYYNSRKLKAQAREEKRKTKQRDKEARELRRSAADLEDLVQTESIDATVTIDDNPEQPQNPEMLSTDVSGADKLVEPLNIVRRDGNFKQVFRTVRHSH
jgi:hypothetical protein